MSALWGPARAVVADAVERALVEDLTPLGDVTSALLDPSVASRAAFVARERGVLSGTDCATETFYQVDPSLEVRWSVGDGATIEPGQELGVVVGSLVSVLTAERTALNFLGHLSGVASLTALYVEALRQVGSTTRIWDTRKTTPGMRALEKAAVRAGGGANHRGNLSDWVLLKDNHLSVIGIAEGVALARKRWPGRTVHVECDRLDQVIEAAAAGADALLLDNMSPAQVSECMTAVDAAGADRGGRRPLVEVSGGLDLETVVDYAHLGVDCISVGRITNSAPVLDVGLDIAPDVIDAPAGRNGP